MYLVHDDPRGELAVGTGGDGVVFAQRGVAVEVPDHVAGERPGEWTPHVAGDGTPLPPTQDDGRAWMQHLPSGVWLVRDLGTGLLAFESPRYGDDGQVLVDELGIPQVDYVWRPATDAEVAAAAAAGDEHGEG